MTKLNKKIISLVLALSICAGTSISAFALSSGYNHSHATESKREEKTEKLEAKQVEKAVDASLKEIKSDKTDTAKVELKNAKELKPDVINKVAAVAKETGKNVVINADVTDAKGNVLVRIGIDAVAAAKLGKPIDLQASTQNKPVNNLFNKYFDNEISLISFNENYSFGLNVRVAAKFNLEKLNVKSLVFYSYNPKTNSYIKIKNPNYLIDEFGYVHFNTERAGSVIISDKPLQSK